MHYRKVGEVILVAGYYEPHASFELAKSLLWRAVHDLRQHGDRALERFNDLNGGFVQKRSYVVRVGDKLIGSGSYVGDF
ncbi:hypothetical protein [Azoarcus sp. DN11]|uniref:hypothetical protein n=1 Tax=Azoarcus sp. DN11 TaxID=356837 RepID=UPI000FE1917D|nr:hypothetical protein [Azoarcus sp. DN11]